MPKQRVPHTGSLYQLFSVRQCRPGDYVAVNGPHDRYGVVMKSEEKDGQFLNLIRGVASRALEKPVASF